MHDQPKYTPLRSTPFFGDVRSAVRWWRAPWRGASSTRIRSSKPARSATPTPTIFPFPVDAAVMARGRERFEIFCTPCHGRTGTGDGMVVQRGYRRPPTYHDDRLRNAPIGHFVDVMANGFGAMPDYSDQVGARDRWAIAAYIRALQLSQHATARRRARERERGALR